MRIINMIKNNILTFAFLTFIGLLMVNYCVGVVFVEESTPYEETEYTEDFIELQKKYATIVNDDAKQPNFIIGKYLGLYTQVTNLVSNYNNFLTKESLLKFNAWLCKNANMSYIPGTSFLKLDDGTLVRLKLNKDPFNKEPFDIQFEYLKHFLQKLEDRNIPFVYVECPSKDRLMNDKLPIGFQNPMKSNEREYMYQRFSEINIPFLNLTEKMIQSEDDLFDMYYKTDHHWKVECGIDAAKFISEYLNSELDYGIDTQIFDQSNYSVKKYENCCLGSIGFNSKETFVDTEDFDVFFPKEKAEISFELPSRNIDLLGDFNVFLDHRNLDNKEKWPFSAYESYIYGNSAYTKIENLSINDNHKILIIKDSYANAIIPYLSQVVKRVDVVDIRTSLPDHFNGSIMSLIDENQYDAVLFIYNAFVYEVDRLYLK